ncbi:Nn.00g117230.m01.CDS01 [Neocucurbitaria sp. VM-36]
MTYGHDAENREPASERSLLLGGSSHQTSAHEQDENMWTLLQTFQFFGGGIYAPDPSTYDPIEILLNTEDAEKRDELTIQWKDNKLSELSFVGVVAALLAGVLTSTGSWPNILPNGEQSPWPVRTSWYCGIILALFSILSTADQTVRLHRLSSHRDGLDNIRKLLSKTNGERKHSSITGRRAPSLLQILTWQMPVMFLTSATICMIVGMFLHVWSATKHLHDPGLWDDNTKVAITYTVIAVVAIILFFLGQISLYSPLRR